MQFIEISDGLSVKTSDIVSVERREDGTSLVTVGMITHESTFPYRVLIDLLSGHEPDKTQEKLEGFLDRVQFNVS